MTERWDRRKFLLRSGATLGAVAGPLRAADAAFARALGDVAAPFRRRQSRPPEDDGAWADVVAAFDLQGRAVMNTANLAPASRPAREALRSLTSSVDEDPSFQNRARFAAAHEETRRRLAAFVGADADEVVLTRNTTEGNNFVVQALDLGPGDEVVVTAHNHPSNLGAWRVRGERAGFSVVEVPVASPPPSPEALLDDLRAACTPATRVIAFSHVTNLGGCRYPARAICRWARRRDVFTLVDGAQTCGAIAVDLHDMGCDAYTASAHKWPCGPREAGLLYLRRGVAADMWPPVVGLGWEQADGAARFETLGQRDDAALAAFGHAVLFLEEIGMEAVGARLAALTGFLKEELERRSGATLYTPRAAEFSAGVVTFHLDGVDPRRAHQWLYEERGIVSAPSSLERGGLRLSPHVNADLQQCERAVAAVRELAGRGVAGA